MAIRSEGFKAALSRFASGVTVVTTLTEKGLPHGITVSAFSSLSLDPPLVLICINKQAIAHGALLASGRFAVNVLAADQEHLSRHFATRPTVGDQFRGISTSTGLSGMPLLDGALASIECTIVRMADGGDHTIFLGQVESSRVSDEPPLLYFMGEYRRLARSGQS